MLAPNTCPRRSCPSAAFNALAPKRHQGWKTQVPIPAQHTETSVENPNLKVAARGLVQWEDFVAAGARQESLNHWVIR
jgi:hypothetical protein